MVKQNRPVKLLTPLSAACRPFTAPAALAARPAVNSRAAVAVPGCRAMPMPPSMRPIPSQLESPSLPASPRFTSDVRVETSIRDMNRTMAPCPRHPSITGRSIRPITRGPDITHARTGRNRSNHCHRRGCDRRCDNDRCRNDDRQRQPDGEPEVNSGVCGHCSRADQHGHEQHFWFHNCSRRFALH